MLIEKELEAKLVSAFKNLPQLKDMEVVGARQEVASGIVKGERESACGGVVAVSVGLRTHDAFSLSPITVSVAVVVSTRAEMDATGLQHERAMEAVTDLLSTWHRFGDVMTQAL